MKDGETSGYSVFFWWLCGIALLTITLFVSAYMGIYQETLHEKYGKHAREAIFITVSEMKFSNFEQ